MEQKYQYLLGGVLVTALVTWYVIKKRSAAGLTGISQDQYNQGWNDAHTNVIGFLELADTRRLTALQAANILKAYDNGTMKAA